MTEDSANLTKTETEQGRQTSAAPVLEFAQMLWSKIFVGF